MTELDKAIAEVKRATGDLVFDADYDRACDVICQAVASGELIPKADPGDDAGLVERLRKQSWCVQAADGRLFVDDAVIDAANRIETLIAERAVALHQAEVRAEAAEQNARLAVAEAIRRLAQMAADGTLPLIAEQCRDAVLALADTDALAEVEALRAERDALANRAFDEGEILATLRDCEAASEALAARVKALTEALTPFAREAEAWPDEWPDSADNMGAVAIYLTKGDFVTALAALAKKEAKPDDHDYQADEDFDNWNRE